MNFFLYTTCLLLTLSGSLVNSQKEPCSYTLNDGVKYDFTSIAGKDVSTTINGYTYHLSICGTSSTQCQNDPDGVVEGMAVQTKPDPFGPKCYVLSQYDDSVTSNNWSPLIGTPSGVSLTLANGSPSDCPAGTPRQLALNFECGSTEEDKSFTVDDGGDCSYVIHYKTCLACAKGCPGGGGGGGGNSGETTFFEIFFIIFISTLGVYCIGGVVFNIYKMEKTGAEAIPNKEFWGSLPGYVKDGFVFTGETTANTINRLRGVSSTSTDYKPATDDTMSYQGNYGPVDA